MALTWTLSLRDALSPAARVAARALGATERALRSLQRSSSKAIRVVLQPVTRSFAAVVSAARAAGKQAKRAMSRAYNAVDDGGAVAGAAGAAGAVAFGAFRGAKHIAEAQAFRGATLAAFQQILGSKEAGQAAFDMAAKTSIAIGADFKESMSSMNSLLAQGFDVASADKMVRQMADLKAINPAANLEGITRAISQIKSTGRLQGDELMQLNEAGLSTIAVYEELAKALKLKDIKGGATALEQVKDLQSDGKISSDMAIKAIQDAITKQTGGGPAGALATQRADKSLMGLMMRANNLKDQMIGAINVDWSPFTGAVTAAMGALQSEKGAAMLEQVGASLSSVLQNLFGNMDQGDFEAFFEKVTSGLKTVTEHVNALIDLWTEIGPAVMALVDVALFAMEGMTKAIQLATPHVGTLADQFTTVGGAVLATVSLIMGVPGMIIGAIAAVGESASAVGSQIVNGIVSGIESGASSVANAIVGVAESAIAAAEEALGIASPSKEFVKVGSQVAAGMAGGIGGGEGAVAGSTERMGDVAVRAGQMAASSVTNNSDASRSLTIGSLNVSGGGSDPRATARHLASELRSLAVSHG